ncbi:unnamed protein product [Larinioides sclopetarius]|uniref:Uncharacterized protein n=1 Tax=Larinioides sclopetarius TaxID=280406 RepID=A0AAV1Z565_9ARAC
MTSGVRLNICQDELPYALHFVGPSIFFTVRLPTTGALVPLHFLEIYQYPLCH